MDTLDYYNEHANEYYERTVDMEMESIMERFLDLLPADGAILDLGCGSGRDSLYFVNEGFDVTAVDGSTELCELARIHIGQDVLNMRFDEIEFQDVFDGVWANASLIHVPSDEIEDILRRIYKSLVGGGILYMSFKHGEFEGVREERYYTDYRTQKLKEVIRSIDGFEIIDIFTSKRRKTDDNKEWINVIARKI